MPYVPATPQTLAIKASKSSLQGNKDSKFKFDPLGSLWQRDLVAEYHACSNDVGARWSIIRQLHQSCSTSMIVLDSIAETISSTDWAIIPTSDAPTSYEKKLAKTYRDKLLGAMCSETGWPTFVSNFVTDLHTSPVGFFTQLQHDGNGFVTSFCGIGASFPRPYYVQEGERYLQPRYGNMLSQVSLESYQRDIVTPAGIWWSDERAYYLNARNYHQTLHGSRASGAYQIGVSKAEKARVRLSLNATLENYFAQVASGSDASGLLIMNNLAHRAIFSQIEKRREERKQTGGEKTSGILVGYNVGDKKGEAAWVSFRSFPADLDLMELLATSEQMVASGYGVKSWRADSSGKSEGGSKFGNAKSAVQLDAQEPGMQSTMAALSGLINNVILRGLPIRFQWVGGSSASDAVKLDNLTKAVQVVSQTANALDRDEQRALLVALGIPKQIMSGEAGVASGSDGTSAKTQSGPTHLNDAWRAFISRVPGMYDDFGFDESKFQQASKMLEAAAVLSHDIDSDLSGVPLELSRMKTMDKTQELIAQAGHNLKITSDPVLAVLAIADVGNKYKDGSK